MAQSTNGNKAFAMVFGLERETKNTYRYNELPTDDGTPPVVGTIYVQKWALGTKAPEKLSVTLQAQE